MKPSLRHLLLISCIIAAPGAIAQPVTGVWKGKIAGKNVELKIIKKGDSLTGTSYYYQSPNSYRRYKIKGYFNDENSVVWWDEALIEEKNSSKWFAGKGASPYRSVADFNCPGGAEMYLNGKATLKDDENAPMKPVDLQKYAATMFPDEWNYVIDNYATGANDPTLIDSIGQLAFAKPVTAPPAPIEKVVTKRAPAPDPKPTKPTKSQTSNLKPKTSNPQPETSNPQPATSIPVLAAAPLSNEQKFHTRSKQVVLEIPISGDSIEVNFYDNAIVDGDSIAIFLNGDLIAEHILLKEQAYTIKLAVTSLMETKDLVMVAENLGSIPPNTSLMIAYVDGKRYEARLESTEQSSAVIRFVRGKG